MKEPVGGGYVPPGGEPLPLSGLEITNPSSFGIPEHLEGLGAVLEEVAEVMYERGSKYGPGNIAQFGELGVLVRLSDKLARLQHSAGRDFADESHADAWIDVIGYGLIGLLWSRGQWPGSEKP